MSTLALTKALAAKASVDRQVSSRGGATSQYLIFSLGGELFGVGSLCVREIIGYGNVTSVPMMPGFIRGVIDLRGAVVPVIDLNTRFGRGKTEVSQRTCIVILEIENDEGAQVLSIVVDAVIAVRQIDGASIEPAPNFGTRTKADFIDGMAKVNGGFVMLLGLGKVMSTDEIATLNGMAANDSTPMEGSLTCSPF